MKTRRKDRFEKLYKIFVLNILNKNLYFTNINVNNVILKDRHYVGRRRTQIVISA